MMWAGKEGSAVFRMLTAAKALRAWNVLVGGPGVMTQAPAPVSPYGVTPEALAMLGHELRTPLAALMGYTEMLAGADSLTDEQRRAWATSAHAAASHLNALVGSLLENGVAGLGAPSHCRETVDASELAAGCCALVRPDAAARGVSLVAPAPGSGPKLHCDPRAMRQILLNLLSNAVKFTPPGGEVRVSVASEGSLVSLVVADTGIGFQEAARRQRAQLAMHGANATPGVGTGAGPGASTGLGLGLPLVRALAALHGGEMILHDGDGGGTLVRVVIPSGLVEAASETSAGQASAPQMMVPCLA